MGDVTNTVVHTETYKKQFADIAQYVADKRSLNHASPKSIYILDLEFCLINVFKIV